MRPQVQARSGDNFAGIIAAFIVGLTALVTIGAAYLVS